MQNTGQLTSCLSFTCVNVPCMSVYIYMIILIIPHFMYAHSFPFLL